MALEKKSAGAIVTKAANDCLFANALVDHEKHCSDSVTMESRPVKYPFPKSIIFIISNEFCERFSNAGMQTILMLYFTQKLMFDEHTATVFYHGSTAVVYFLCIFGAIISDSWLGKFKTIIYFSSVYALGSLIIAIGAIPTLDVSPAAATIAGLVLIGIGSGGISPCVSAFGGDQFKLPAQMAQMTKFFSVFYFTIMAGSLLATFFIPILRHDVHCFDDTDCYSLAFGVPSILMMLSIVFFACGKSLYKINPPSGNMLVLVTKCIKNAIATRRREKRIKACKHWLDYSERKYGKQLVADVRTLLKVLVLYIPLPLFWSLYGQQGSRWIIQATKTNGDIGFYHLRPDQMLSVHPFLVMVFIPIFRTVFYPLLAKIGIRRPLQKMSMGMFLAAVAFLMSGLLELELEKTHPVPPSENQAQMRFINGLPCNFTVNTNISSVERFSLNQFRTLEVKLTEANLTTAYDFTLSSSDPNCPKSIKGGQVFDSKTAITLFVTGREIKEKDAFDNPQKARIAMIHVLFSSLGETPLHEVEIITPSNNNRTTFAGSSPNRRLVPIISGVHEVYIDGKYSKTIKLKDESVSALVVLEAPNEKPEFQVHFIEISRPSSISMMWQLPQIVVMTFAEIMFSITGYEFSYAQAPASLKSVLQACWLLTVAFGTLFVTVIAGSRLFQSQANEFFLFAGLMVLDLLLFIALAKNYKGVIPPTSDSDDTTIVLAISTSTINDSQSMPNT